MKIYNPTGFSSKLTGSFSGSFVGDGSNITSISSDNIDFNFTAISSSAQIAEDISGSFTSLSSSISSERLKNTTDTLTGDLTVTGTITAQEFHTEFVSGSIIYESGSTQFGNSSDDTHVFRGQLFVSASDVEDILTSKNYSATGAPEQFQIKHLGGSDSVESLRGNLHLSASNGAVILQRDGGHVGIGNNSPTEDLANGGFTFIADASDDTFTQGPLLQFNGHNGTIRPASTSARIQIEGNGVHLNSNWANDVFLAAGGGCVGIGTDSAGSKLEVRDVQNAESLIKLFNNRQDSSNSPIFGIEASNASPVAKISFYRGGESASGFMTFSTKLNNAASLTEKMRLDASGNLGIGTNDPTNGKIEIQQTDTAAGLWVQTGGTTSSYIIADFRTGTNNPALAIRGNSTSAFGGSVGIGTTDPINQLHIANSGTPVINLERLDDLLGEGNVIGTLRFTSESPNTIISQIYAQSDQNYTTKGRLVFETNDGSSSAERMRITSAGQIFFGVQGTSGGDITNGGFLYRNDSNKYLQFASGTHSNAPLIYFYRKDSGGTSVDTVGNISYADTNLIINGSGQTGQIIAAASGYVGINTTPAHDFHVGGTTARLRVGPFYTDGGGDRDFVDLLANSQDSKVISNNERFHIENNSGDILLMPSGNVGIGVTNPYGKFHIQHTPSTTYNDTSFNSEPHITLIGNDGTNYYRGIRFSNNSGNREAFFGTVQTGDSSPFVFQVYGTTDGYKERLRIGGKNGYASMYARDYPQTSTSSTTSIVDTGIIPEDGIYEIFIKGNANAGGSGAYKTVVHGYLYVAVDYTAPNIVTQIVYNQIGQEGGGSGNNTFTVEAKILYNGTEYSEVNYSIIASAQIRIKITGYNSSHVGSAQNVRILKRI